MYKYSSAYCFDACKVTALLLTPQVVVWDWLVSVSWNRLFSQMVVLSEECEILENEKCMQIEHSCNIPTCVKGPFQLKLFYDSM